MADDVIPPLAPDELDADGNPIPAPVPEDRMGTIAYEAYCATTGWKSLATGADLPPWYKQSPAIKAAWNAAAAAVRAAG